MRTTGRSTERTALPWRSETTLPQIRSPRRTSGRWPCSWFNLRQGLPGDRFDGTQLPYLRFDLRRGLPGDSRGVPLCHGGAQQRQQRRCARVRGHHQHKRRFQDRAPQWELTCLNTCLTTYFICLSLPTFYFRSYSNFCLSTDTEYITIQHFSSFHVYEWNVLKRSEFSPNGLSK